MSIYDCFYDSIAGMHRAQGYLDQAARVIADPASWGMDSAGTSSATSSTSGASFADILSGAMSRNGEGGTGTGGGGNPATYTPPVSSALDGLGVGQGEGPQDIMDAMILALIAQRMYEANARIFAIQNKVVGIIIHLGEENYRPDS